MKLHCCLAVLGLSVFIGQGLPAQQAPAQQTPVKGATPLARLLAPQSEREPAVRRLIQTDVEAWRGLGLSELLAVATPIAKDRKSPSWGVRRSTVKSVVAERLLQADLASVDPETIDALYQLGLPRLTSQERVRVRQRFELASPWNRLSAEKLLAQVAPYRKGGDRYSEFLHGQATKLAARQVLRGDLAKVKPETISELYKLGSIQLTAQDRVRVSQRFERAGPWSQLSASELLAQVAPYRKGGDQYSEFLHAQATKLAAKQVLRGDLAKVEPETISKLYKLGSIQLTDEDRVRVSQRFEQAGPWSQLSAEALLAQVAPYRKGGDQYSEFLHGQATKLAAKQVLRGDLAKVEPGAIGDLYKLGSIQLTAQDRVRVRQRFEQTGPWSELSASELLAQVAPFRKGGDRYSELLHGVASSLSAGHLRDETVLKNSSADELLALWKLGRSNIDKPQQKELRSQILRLRAVTTNASFEELESLLQLATLGRGTPESGKKLREMVAQWAEANRIGELGLSQLGTLLSALRPQLLHQAGSDVTTTWSGSLSVPRDGEYKFSISPIDPSVVAGANYVWQTVSVTINGEEIIRAEGEDDQTADDWVWKSAAVSLAKEQRVPVQFELIVNRSNWPDAAPDAIVAMLCWEGPGLSRQVIPASAYATEDGKPGLSVEYRFHHSGQSRTDSGVDTNIEAVGYSSLYFHEHRKLRERLARLILSRHRMVPPEQYDPENPGSIFSRAVVLALEATTCAGRRDWIERVCQSPVLLDELQPQHFVRFFDVARGGVEEDSLDLVFAWAERHADDVVPVYSSGSYKRPWYREFATDFLGCEHAGALASLEEDGLTDEAGHCNLPIAYLCAYGCRARGEILEWIEKLDAVLEDESVVGDARVNWLIARAMAEEIRNSPVGRRSPVTEQLSAGQGYLDEAALVAQSDAKRLQVLEETIARRLAEGRIDSARQRLDQDRQKIGNAGQAIERLEQAIAGVAQAKRDKAAVADQQRVASITAELKRRQKLAAGRGDTSASDGYADTIRTLESRENPSSQ